MRDDPALNTSAIELSGVSVVRRGRCILSDIDLTVEAGTCCAILGPNGSGKSALMAVISGYFWPSAGTVAVHGQVYGRVSLSDVRRTMGLIEPSRAPKFSERICVRDVVATGLFGTIMLPPHQDVSAAQWRRAEEELDSVGLAGFAEQRYGNLSTGEQMKVLLARAMVSDARILLFDEPTVGLDLGARAACIGVLDELLSRPDPPTVVIVSHHFDELPQAVEKVVLLKGGTIMGQGSPDALLTSEKLSALYDARVDVFRRNGRLVAAVHSVLRGDGSVQEK